MSAEPKSFMEEMDRPVLAVVPADHGPDGILQEALRVVRDLASPEECAGGKAGGCRMHNWQNRDRPCPHQRARALLARWESAR